MERYFPTIARVCRRYGIEITRQPIPVAPAAHYMIGGIRTDVWGRTCLPGLFAAGECASTGVHGANRLASNSLLEAVVFARRIGRVLGRGAVGTTRPSRRSRSATLPHRGNPTAAGPGTTRPGAAGAPGAAGPVGAGPGAAGPGAGPGTAGPGAGPGTGQVG